MQRRAFAFLLNTLLLFLLCSCGGVDSATEPATDDSSELELSKEGISTQVHHTSRVTEYGADGTCLYWLEYGRNAEGKQVSITSYRADGNKNGHIDFLFDAQGNQIIDYTIHGGEEDAGKITMRKLEYDNSGNVVKELSYDDDSGLSLNSYQEYEYDTSGNRISMSYYSADGQIKLQESYGYEYDSAGNCVCKKTYKYDETCTSYELYEYDSLNNIIAESNYIGVTNGEYYLSSDMNYENGHPLQYNYYSGGPDKTLEGYIAYSYNDSGGTSEIVRYAVIDGQEYLTTRTVYEW